ncbi:MAG TPA: hypothetical protein VM888_01000 [Chitinophagaceae bacterium]|nr:hypothetical protein [Chitinophagaceae bacterium]
MRKSYLLILFMLAINVAFAQPDPVRDFNRHIIEKWGGDYIRVGPYRVKGSPFFLGESFPGMLKYKGGKTIKNTNVLYNLYEQKAGVDLKNEIYESGEVLEEFKMELPDKFGKQSLLFKNSSLYGDGTLKSYLNVLAEGSKASFLKQFKTKLIPDPTNTLSKDDKVFEQYYEYYLYAKGGAGLQKIKLRQKDILKELGDDPKLKDYISKNGLDLSKEEGVIQLINIYNSAN